MYGDSDVIRRRAASVRDQGADVRTLADELVGRVEALAWSGRAADAMATRVAERAAHLRAVADRHIGAADALADHAEAVDFAGEQIAVIETRVAALVADARARVEAINRSNAEAPYGQSSTVTPDPADEALLAFEPPPPGHRAWLEVDVPGQER